jgi:hypothetical protein
MCDCRYGPSVTTKILAAQYLALVPLWLQRDSDDTDPGQTKLKHFNVCVSCKETTSSLLWLDVTVPKDECAMQDFTAIFLKIHHMRKSLHLPKVGKAILSWRMYVILKKSVLHIGEGRYPGVHWTKIPFLTWCGSLVTCWYHWRLYCAFTRKLQSDSILFRKVRTDIGGVSLLSGTTRRGNNEVQLCIQHVPSLLQRKYVLIQILWRAG